MAASTEIKKRQPIPNVFLIANFLFLGAVMASFSHAPRLTRKEQVCLIAVGVGCVLFAFAINLLDAHSAPARWAIALGTVAAVCASLGVFAMWQDHRSGPRSNKPSKWPFHDF